MKSRFHEAAESDLTKQFRYYTEATPGLGDKFVSHVFASVQVLEQFPEGARAVSGNIRAKPITGFPHTLLYTIEEHEIVILAVAHQRQDLEAWLRIVRDRNTGRAPNSA